jgi:hypothetical protein
MMMSVSLVRGNEMVINGYKCDDKGTRIDRFHLEQAIMEAWQTSTDIKMVYNSWENMTDDQMMGAVDGLHIFAEMRFESLWETFESLLHNMRVDKNDVNVNKDVDTHEPTAGIE